MLVICEVLYADAMWDIVCWCYVRCCMLMLCGTVYVDIMWDFIY